MDEPVADTVRGILDGHIVLSRDLAQAFHYPAIDVLASVSRLAPYVSGGESRKAAGFLRRNMAAYSRVEDLINVGAYRQGLNPEVDEAISLHGPINEFLNQEVNEPSSLEDTLVWMSDITGVDIPREEMTDNNVKLTSVQGSSMRRQKQQKIETAALDVSGSSKALNTVASLFSTLPGMSVVG